MTEYEIDGYRVEFDFDPEVATWHFRVPVLHIVGGGQGTLEESRLAAAEAIEFALED